MATFFDLMKNMVMILNTFVRVEDQELTEEQKTTVRENLDVPAKDEFVIVQTTVANMKADMEYVPIEIIKISDNVGTVELGTAVPEMTVTWELNKTPASQQLGGEDIGVDVRSMTVSMVDRKSVTLTVTDERGATVSKSTGYNAYNGVYCGAAADPETLDSIFVRGLVAKTLSDNRARTVTIKGYKDTYIWYALPVRLGECTFTVDGFVGGFILADTIEFTNVQGYTEPYYVYRSENIIPGETKVVIS